MPAKISTNFLTRFQKASFPLLPQHSSLTTGSATVAIVPLYSMSVPNVVMQQPFIHSNSVLKFHTNRPILTPQKWFVTIATYFAAMKQCKSPSFIVQVRVAILVEVSPRTHNRSQWTDWVGVNSTKSEGTISTRQIKYFVIILFLVGEVQQTTEKGYILLFCINLSIIVAV